MRSSSLAVLLLVFWAALSFEFDNLFLVGSGIVCAAGVALLVLKTELLITDWRLPQYLKAAVLYLPWLTWQVVLANLRVIYLVWHPRLPIDPRLVEVPCHLKTGTGRAVFANSITLTPGTVTVDVKPGRLLVHALTEVDGEGLLAGDMQERVQRLEPES